MSTLKQKYFASWSKEEQEKLKKEINEEYEQNFKSLVKEWLQQKPHPRKCYLEMTQSTFYDRCRAWEKFYYELLKEL